MTSHVFAIVTRDEVWSDRALVESRLSHGIATTGEREIIATDACDEALLAEADAELARARRVLVDIPRGRVRIIVTARRGHRASTLTISHAGLSVVTTPEHATTDYELLRNQPGEGAHFPYRDISILWRNGSGSILVHEAIGHAAEHDHFSRWPDWLSVMDEPTFEFDDTGGPTRPADLLTEGPKSFRRQTFTDVPLRRMTNLVVRHRGAPFELPEPRIEIHLVNGGRYEPLTGTITLYVTAARLIDGTTTTALAPFVITETRDDIARALRGATGETERYPGVVCSREGQEIIVGSHARLLLTRF